MYSIRYLEHGLFENCMLCPDTNRNSDPMKRQLACMVLGAFTLAVLHRPFCLTKVSCRAKQDGVITACSPGRACGTFLPAPPSRSWLRQMDGVLLVVVMFVCSSSVPL